MNDPIFSHHVTTEVHDDRLHRLASPVSPGLDDQGNRRRGPSPAREIGAP